VDGFSKAVAEFLMMQACSCKLPQILHIGVLTGFSTAINPEPLAMSYRFDVLHSRNSRNRLHLTLLPGSSNH
jgi:hypothetical protein